MFFSKTFGELIYPTIQVILATFAISQPHQLNISKMRLKLFWKCLEFWGEMDKDKLGVSLSLANTSWNRSIVQEMRHWKQGLGCKICSTEEANNKWPLKLFHIKGPPTLIELIQPFTGKSYFGLTVHTWNSCQIRLVAPRGLFRVKYRNGNGGSNEKRTKVTNKIGIHWGVIAIIRHHTCISR